MVRIHKILITIMLSASIILAQYVAFASESKGNNVEKANALKNLGLFNGTNSGFELDRCPTRVEGAVMLIRLLGKETIAKKENNEHPFSDVPNWASPYIGYMYKNGLTTGKSKNEFGSNDSISAVQYMTFILRALGYDDSKGDFNWLGSIDKAKQLGIIGYQRMIDLKNNKEFLRDDVVYISYNALKAEHKVTGQPLVKKLIGDQVVSSELSIDNGLIPYPQITESIENELNLTNSFFVAYKDNRIYFKNFLGGNGSLYRMKYDGTQVTRIRDKFYSDINISDDYVYFSDNGYLSRINLDGSGYIKVCPAAIDHFVIQGDYIYYTNSEDRVNVGPFSYPQLYRMRLDGSEKTNISHMGCSAFYVSAKGIFFDGVSDISHEFQGKKYSGNLSYIMNLDGSNKRLVSSDRPAWINTFNDKIYFVANKYGEPCKITQMDWDGTNQKVLYANSDLKRMLLYNEKIYFTLSRDFNVGGALYQMNIDGAGLKLICENVAHFGIVGDWIYYVQDFGTKDAMIYRIRTDGTNKELFSEEEWKK